MLKIKNIKPVFNSIVTTGEKYEEDMYDEHGLIEYKMGDLKTYQRVVAVGSTVRDIQVGDMVMLNMMNYAIKKYDPNSLKEDMGMNKTIQYAFNWLTVDGQECMLFNDRDVLFVFEGEEVQGVKNPIIVPKKGKLIVN